MQLESVFVSFIVKILPEHWSEWQINKVLSYIDQGFTPRVLL